MAASMPASSERSQVSGSLRTGRAAVATRGSTVVIASIVGGAGPAGRLVRRRVARRYQRDGPPSGCSAGRRDGGSGSALEDLPSQAGGLARGLADLDAGRLEGLLLRLGGPGRAGDDRAGVAHRPALAGSEARGAAHGPPGTVGLGGPPGPLPGLP